MRSTSGRQAADRLAHSANGQERDKRERKHNSPATRDCPGGLSIVMRRVFCLRVGQTATSQSDEIVVFC